LGLRSTRLFSVLFELDLKLIYQVSESSQSCALLTNTDFLDLREVDSAAIESPHHHAAKWKEIEEAAEVAVVDTVKEAIGFVRNRYENKGAVAFVVGSTYQAGAALVLLQTSG
jgi:hypothetical protein